MTQNSARPLSPHLQVYKPQLTSVLSILHRITGILLSAFAVGWLVWLVCLNRGPHALDTFNSLLNTIPGKLMCILATWALFYHLLNGVRHLVWDTGRWLELDAARRAGWAVVVLSLVLSVVAWGYWS